MKHSFYFDSNIILKIVPNFDGPNDKSKTYTIYFKDGDSLTLNCKGPDDFQTFEDGVKAHQKYKDKQHGSK